MELISQAIGIITALAGLVISVIQLVEWMWEDIRKFLKGLL